MAFVHILPYLKGLCPEYSSVLPPVHRPLLFLLPEMPFPLVSVDEIDVVETGTLQEASFGFHPGGAAGGHPWVLVLARREHVAVQELSAAPAPCMNHRPSHFYLPQGLTPGLAHAFPLLDLTLSAGCHCGCTCYCPTRTCRLNE